MNQHNEVIVNGQDTNINADDWYIGTTPAIAQDSSRYIDIQRIGQHFIEVFNDGTLYFWTMNDATRTIDYVTTQIGTFDASVDDEGSLNICIPTNSSTIDGSAWYTIDNNTGELNFQNFPEEETGIYTWIDKYGNSHTEKIGIYEYLYLGGVQSDLFSPGTYKIECWGA